MLKTVTFQERKKKEQFKVKDQRSYHYKALSTNKDPTIIPTPYGGRIDLKIFDVPFR